MPGYMNDLELCQIEIKKCSNKFRKAMLNGTKIDIENAIKNLNHLKAIEAKLAKN